MKKTNCLLFIPLAVVLIAAGCNKTVQQNTQTTTNNNSQQTNSNTQPTTNQNSSLGVYKDYSADLVKNEQAAGQKVIYFFHATWCPECRAIDADLKAHPEKVPTGVTVLKVDYDTSGDLKKQFGITTQHTFVQIDTSGNQVVKWISEDADSIAKKVK